VPDSDRWLERALAARPSAQGALAVAVTLEGQGRDALAIGVLELAWRAHPGDRRLRRARVQRDLPVGVLPANGPEGTPTPAHLFSDPATGLFVTTFIPPPPSPLTLDAASAAFDELNARQTTRVARVAQLVDSGASADEVADALIVWVVGRRASREDARETRRALTALRSLRRGRARRWATHDLTATLDLDAVEAALEARLPHDDAP